MPGQIGALLRLVEVCVDGGLEATMYEAQAQLADAYLAADRAEEARVIAEDLVSREPHEVSHIERLRTALTMLDVDDVEGAIAARIELEQIAGIEAEREDETRLTDVELVGPGPTPAVQPATAPSAPAAPAAAPAVAAEIDLTTMLGELEGQAAPGPATAAPPRPAPDLEDVFAAMRYEAAAGVEADDSAEHLALAHSYLEAGQVDDAIAPLTVASRSPQYRFAAASMLDRSPAT